MGSQPARIYGALDRALMIISSLAWILSPILMVVYTIAQILFLSLPLYIFGGDVKGYIGILGYKLEVFQHQVRSPTLDSLATLAIPVIISIPIAIISTILRFIGQGSRSWIALGGAGIAVIASGISESLRGIASLVASKVASNYSSATSAGYIYFQGVDLSGTAALIMPIVAYFSSIAAMILLAVYVIFKPHERSRRDL